MPQTTESPAIALTKAQLRVAQACDQCNYRKIKCRSAPGNACSSCIKSHLACTWERPPAKRGPKRPSRPGVSTEHNPFDAGTSGSNETPFSDPAADLTYNNVGSSEGFVPPWTVSTTRSMEDIFGESSASSQLPDFMQTLLPVGFWASYPTQHESLSAELDWTMLSSDAVGQTNTTEDNPDLLASNTFQDMYMDSFPESSVAPNISYAEPESVVRVACAKRSAPSGTTPLPENAAQITHRLQEFFRLLAPYIPVINSDELWKAYESGEHDHSILFRALLLSILGLAAAVGVGTPEVEAVSPLSPSETGPRIKKQKQADRDLAMAYLEGAQLALATATCNSEPTVAAVVTSVHLFMAWEWARDHRKSWLHLQQAITMAQFLEIDHLAAKPIPADMFLVTRLKLYYLLSIIERSHALLRPSSLVHSQALRFPGKPWTETRAFRESLPPNALAGFQIRITQALDNAGDKLIRCWRGLCGLKDPFGKCWEWTIDFALQLQYDLGRQMEDVSKWKWQPTAAGPDFETLKMSNLAATIAWLRDLCWNVCRTHRLVSWDSAHPVLRYSFVLDNLTQLLDAGPVGCDGFNQDVSLDSYAKLLDVTMTAIKTVEELMKRPGGVDESGGAAERLRQELLVPVLKSVTLFTSALGTHSMTSTLVKAVATIC